MPACWPAEVRLGRRSTNNRFSFGVGIGWAQKFGVGVPYAKQGQTRVMR